MALASIIIATHSRPHLLPRAVASAHAAGTDVEVVVVDDASRDETANVCGSLRGIKYVRVDRNQQVAGARNIGLVASSGKYLTFLDDDDTRLPGSLDWEIERLENEPEAGLIYAQAVYADQNGGPMDRVYPAECPTGDVFWQLLTQNFIPCGSAVFRRSCVASLGLLDDTIPGLDDWDLWIRIAEIYPVVAVEQPAVTWRRSTPASGQGTSEAAKLVSQSARKFKKSWINLPRARSAPPYMRRAAWRRFSENMLEHLLFESGRAAGRGRALQPLKNCAVVPRLDPLAAFRVAKNRLLHSKS